MVNACKKPSSFLYLLKCITSRRLSNRPAQALRLRTREDYQSRHIMEWGNNPLHTMSHLVDIQLVAKYRDRSTWATSSATYYGGDWPMPAQVVQASRKARKECRREARRNRLPGQCYPHMAPSGRQLICMACLAQQTPEFARDVGYVQAAGEPPEIGRAHV